MDNSELSSGGRCPAAGDRGAAADRPGARRVEWVDIDPATQARLARAYREGRRFFSLAEERKLTAVGPHGCGYRPFGLEHSGNPDCPDRLESFLVAPGIAPKAAAGDAERLHMAMLRVFEGLEPLAESIMLRWAAATGGESHIPELRRGFRRWSTLQMNYALPSEATDFVSTVHDDLTFLTLCHALAEGLETEETDGSFVLLPVPAERLAVLPGQVAMVMSGGQITAVRHRVRGGAPGRRLSMVFFADLQPSACRPWAHDAERPDVDLAELVRKSQTLFGLPPFPDEAEEGA